MANVDATIRLLSLDDDSNDLLMITNDAETMEVALEVARSTTGVECVEVSGQDMAEYIMPGSPEQANEIGDQGPFKYRVYVNAPHPDALGPRLVDRIERELSRRNLSCAVIYQ